MKMLLRKNADVCAHTAHMTMLVMRNGWRFLLQRALRPMGCLLLLIFWANVQAASVITGDLAKSGAELSISEKPYVSAQCRFSDALTRNFAGWKIMDESGKILEQIYHDFANDYSSAGEYGAKVEITKNLEPGKTYAIESYCAVEGYIALTLSDRKTFTVRPLDGEFTATTKEGNIIVDGTLQNGANRVTVYDGAKLLGEVDNIDGSFSIKIPAGAKEHDISVSVHYKEHSKLLGHSTITVHKAPELWMAPAPPPYTNRNSISLDGLATSEAKIKESAYHWENNRGSGWMNLDIPSIAKTVDMTPTFTFQQDGWHMFKFWAKASDEQVGESELATIIVDRHPPKIEVLEYKKEDNYVGEKSRVWMKVIDLYNHPEDGPIEDAANSSGIDSVLMEIIDKDGKRHGWKTMQESLRFKGDYSGVIPFDDLPEGEFTASVWAVDKAKNEKYLDPVKFKKAPLPKITAAVGKQQAGEDKIVLSISAQSDAKVKKVSIAMWKKGEVQGVPHDLKIDKPANEIEINYSLKKYAGKDMDGEYFFQLFVEGVDGQKQKTESVKVTFDDTAPTIDLVSPQQNSTQKNSLDLKVAVKDDGSGVKDVRMRVCQSAADCGKDGWTAAIESDKPDEYAATLPLASLEPGAFIVTVWARDKAENELKTTFTYKKEIEAGGALTASLTLDMVGAQSPQPVVAQQAPFVYRVVLAAKKQTIQRPSLRFRLPGGLFALAAPVLTADGDGDGDGAEVSINPQWDGESDDALLADGGILHAGQVVAIEVTVAVKEVVDSGVAVQSTIVAGAGNLTGTLQALHRVTVGERPAAGNRVRLEKSVDANAAVLPGALIKYTLRVGNPTFETVRKLLIRDHVPDHTKLEGASCGNLPAGICQVYSLNDEDVADGVMTHAGMCGSSGRQSDPDGRHVIWCLNGELAPLSEYSVDYTIRVDGGP